MTDRRQRFEQDGYLVIPGFASRADCDQLRETAHAIVANIDPAELELEFDVHEQRHAQPWFLDSGAEVRAFIEPERDGGAARVNRSEAAVFGVNKLGHALHDRVPEFDRFSRDPRLAALVAELGVAQPLLLQSMVIFKGPRIGGEVTPHQDATFLYTEPSSVIGLWFALEDATCDNGCLEVLPGAHREGLRSRYRREGYRTWMDVLDPRPWPSDGWVPIEAPAGTLVVFHGFLPHRSGPNRSAVSRCAYTLHVIDGAAEYVADNWLQRPPDMPLRGFS
ncbi:MAG TPA: phytanoyl-CoA dioxygenase family protein [Enhygromyxa sp.]|nr:phytanoyl-CoA dioxygenase family protein [Enhygromyxa sp.]